MISSITDWVSNPENQRRTIIGSCIAATYIGLLTIPYINPSTRYSDLLLPYGLAIFNGQVLAHTLGTLDLGRFCNKCVQSVLCTKFNRGLQRWVEESDRGPEYETRQAAADIIKECYLNRETTLDLRRFMVPGDGTKLTSLPPQIGELSHLEFLFLEGHELTDLPLELNKLKALQRLYLGNNKFTVFPDVISSLGTLQSLDLWGNQLKKLHPSIENLKNLKALYLSDNELTTPPHELLKLPSLEQLFLSGCSLSKGPIIPPNLCRLDLSNNKITGLSLSSILDYARLESLDISQNPLREPSKTLSALDAMARHSGSHCQIRVDLSNATLERLIFTPPLPKEGEVIDNGVIFTGYVPARNHIFSELPLDRLLKHLYKLENREQPDLSSLKNQDPEGKLQNWLARLLPVIEYRIVGSKQEAFCKISEYLERANRDPAFQRLFFVIISEACNSHEDWVASFLIDLEIAKNFLPDPKNQAPNPTNRAQTIEKLEGLMKDFWAIAQFKQAARTCSDLFIDSLEFYFACCILSESSFMGQIISHLDPKNMRWLQDTATFDLNSTYQGISKKQQSPKELLHFLEGDTYWEKLVQAFDPETDLNRLLKFKILGILGPDLETLLESEFIKIQRGSKPAKMEILKSHREELKQLF